MMHPRFSTISAYADETLSPGRRTRVSTHVARCGRCRETLAGIRALTRAAAALPDTPLPPGQLDQVLARRAAGERMVLPLADTPPRAPAQPALRIAASIALLAVTAAVLMFASTPRLEAVSSDLRLSPAAPRAGEAVEMAYTPGSRFAGARALNVRARLRRPGDEYRPGSRNVAVLTTLRRGRDGMFRGEVRLPDSVVYAALSVETADGSEVDTNQRRLWEVLVHDSAGRPLAAALLHRADELTGRDWERGYETAQQMSRLYPHDPESGHTLSFFEQVLLGAASSDSLLAIHRPRFQALHTGLRGRAGVDGQDTGAMFFYAWTVNDSVAREFWKDRLESDHPRHPLAVQNRALALMRRHYDQPAVLLGALDSLWGVVGAAHPQLGLQGIRAARRAGDPDAIRRWTDRYLQLHPGDVVSVAGNNLSAHPALREEALRLLRGELARLRSGDDGERFGITRAEFRDRREKEAARLMAVLGRHLLAAGHTRAALDTLSLAAERVWDADVFMLAARARLQAGDPAGAAPLLARAAVDPGTSAARRDSLAQLARAFDSARWAAGVQEARRDMRERVLAESVRRTLPVRIRLTDSTGAATTLGGVLGDAPAVVVFWSRHCGPALQSVPDLNALAASLKEKGVRVIVLTGEAPSPALAADVARLGLAVPLYHDVHRDATRAFAAGGTPEYFVLDADGRIRYEYTSLPDIPRQSAVLQQTDG